MFRGPIVVLDCPSLRGQTDKACEQKQRVGRESPRSKAFGSQGRMEGKSRRAAGGGLERVDKRGTRGLGRGLERSVGPTGLGLGRFTGRGPRLAAGTSAHTLLP